MNLNLNPLGANVNELIMDDGSNCPTTILFSYRTPVAMYLYSKNEGCYNYIVTEKKHSSTTSRHITNWLRRKTGFGNYDAIKKPQSWFDSVCSTPSTRSLK